MNPNREAEECYVPVERETLDVLVVGKQCPCGCKRNYSRDNPLSFTGACHPHAPNWTEYWDGVVTVRCGVCRRLILRIQVAGSDPHGVALAA